MYTRYNFSYIRATRSISDCSMCIYPTRLESITQKIKRSKSIKMASEDEIVLPSQGDNIIRTREPDFYINPKGIAHELYTSMKKHENKIGQIEAETGKEETFGVILQRAIRVACHLKKLGLTPNDVITPCTTNHLNTSVIFHAILLAGVKLVSMDPFAPDEDRIRQLELVQPKLLFTIPECVNALENMIEKLGLKTKIVVFGETKIHTPFDNFLIPLPHEESNFAPFTVTDVYETAFIIFCGGTTGSPKGICISHYAALTIFGRVFKTEDQSQAFLSYASLVWASAVAQTLLTAVFGLTKIVASGFSTEKVWKHLVKYKVSTLFLAPQDIVSLVKSGKPTGLELPHLKVLLPAGGATSHQTFLKLQEMFPTTAIFVIYGQTELWNTSTALDFSPSRTAQRLSRPGTCGRPVRGSTYKIVDPETGRILGPNEPGELCIKSKSNMNGYYKADYSDRFDKDGFLKTGDILYYDEEYWFFFVERCKEMLRYKMITIAPTELEGILIEHPSVKVAVVIGVPTEDGDLATAIVVKKDENVTAEELEHLVESKVDERKKLRGGVRFVDESVIPFAPSGKIKRKTLRDYVLKNMLT